ncbi:MAG: hypothetical protein HZRFUVUK_001248 [Candidatus Fervidibacterota bacterium]
MVRCDKCGTENREEAKFCIHCGKPLSFEEVTAPPTEYELAEAPKPEEAEGELREFGAEPTAMPTDEKGEEALTLEQPPVEDVLEHALFVALPEGALLCGRKYELRRILLESERLNIYEGVSTEQFKRCHGCGNLSPLEDKFCNECGASLEDAPQCIPMVTVVEAPANDEELLNALEGVAEEAREEMPRVIERFSETPYGDSKRIYVVFERVEGSPLSLETMPTDYKTQLEIIARLLRLAKALSKRSLLLPEVGCVVTVDKRIILNSIEAVRFVSPQEETETKMSSMIRSHLIESLERYIGSAQSVVEKKMASRLLDDVSAIGEEAPLDELISRVEAALSELSGVGVLRYESVGMSDVGKVRELNEDGFIIYELTGFQQPSEFHIGLYAVADGMGGHEAGEVACKLALNALLETVQQEVLKTLAQNTSSFFDVKWGEVLRRGFENANKVVYERAKDTHSDMGTTMVAALVVGNRVYIANVGDSRAYVLSRSLRQVTKDHSLVQQLVDIGQITPQEARVHPHRHVIYRAIGLHQHVEVDMFEELLSAGDKLLLCSDGLCDMLEDSEIEGIMLSEQEIDKACKELIRRANENGGFDNITAVIVVALQA